MNVEILLTDHHPDNHRGIHEFGNRVHDALKDSGGDVYVLLEDTGVSNEVAARIEFLSEQNVPPAFAYVYGTSINIPLEGIDYSNLNDRYSTDVSDRLCGSLEAVRAQELSRLDLMHIAHNAIKSNNAQLRILVEPYNDDLSASDPDWIKEARMDAWLLIEQGDFEDAIRLHRQQVEQIAQDVITREQAVMRKIHKKKLKDGDNVLIKFGSAHTGLRIESEQILDLDPKVTFLDKSDGVYLYSPLLAAIRKARFFGIDSISDMEMYQSLLGDYCCNTLDFLRQQYKDHINFSDQQLISWSNQFARSFDSVERVEAFRTLVLKSNAIDATLEWGSKYGPPIS